MSNQHDEPTELEPGAPGSLETELEGRPGGGPDDGTGFIAHNLPAPLAGTYRIVRRLGMGGQGSVYLCEQLADGAQVAIKLYSVAMSKLDGTVIEKLSHAPSGHIVPTTFGQWGEECWEIQEYLPLGTVADIRQHLGGTLPDEVARAIVGELADAVAAAHELDLIHRDIKPSNILVRQLEPLDLVLADFGLVRSLVAGAQHGSRSATPGYRSPDTAQGIWRWESDWWAVGITLYEVLQQRHPFDDEHGYRKDDITILGYLVENEVPLDGVTDERWLLLLRGLLTKSAEHRWGAEEVRSWLAGGSPALHRPGPTASTTWSFTGFGGQQYGSTTELGRAMAARWEEAGEYLNGRGRTTLHNALAQTPLAERAHQIFDRFDKNLIRTDGLVFELVRLLAPDDPLAFRGRELTARGLGAVAAEAASGSATAARWINTLRSESVLANTLGHPGHGVFAQIGHRLDQWWDSLPASVDRLQEARTSYRSQACGGSEASGDLGAVIRGEQALWEGELLRAALDPDHASRLQQATATHVAEQAAPAAPWVDLVVHAAAGPEPDPVSALLATASLPLAQADSAEARAIEDAARQQALAAAAEQRRERRRQMIRGAWPNEDDLVIAGLAIGACVTVLVPWIVGLVLRGKLGRDDGYGVEFTAARQVGAYFKTDWLAGCFAVLLVAALVLAVRALFRQRIGPAIVAVVLLIASIVVMSISDDAWDTAEQATARRAYDPEFNNKYTCGGVVSDTDPQWSLWTFQLENSEFEGCNGLWLFRGLEKVEWIKLNEPQWASRGFMGSGAELTVNDATTTSDVVFTYHGDGGRTVVVRVADYE